MSPRSQEFIDDARRRLAAARTNLESGLPFIAVGAAYDAMLYAARAALSEEDLYAKTHSGTWTLFARTFVAPGRFDAALLEPVQRIREQREAADYEASDPSEVEAAAATERAESFVDAVARMLEPPSG